MFFISQDGRLADLYGILSDNFLQEDLLTDHFWPMLIFLDKTFIEKKNINPKPEKDIENITLTQRNS